MVLTGVQITAFFTEDAQIGIPQATVNHMQQEGITSVDDLIDFDNKSIKELAVMFQILQEAVV